MVSAVGLSVDDDVDVDVVDFGVVLGDRVEKSSRNERNKSRTDDGDGDDDAMGEVRDMFMLMLIQVSPVQSI